MNLIISPHPDDIALSIGCYISSLAGKKLIIITHSKSLHDDGITDQTVTRKEEELAFANTINADVVFLDLPDTNYRGISWKQFNFVLDKQEHLQISNAIVHELKEYNGLYTLFIPLGIGLHPDHIACYYSSLQFLSIIKPLPQLILFYEEIPYSFLTKKRLASQRIFSKATKSIEVPYNIKEKKDLLSLYTSQLQTEYICNIISKHQKEQMYEVNYPYIINNDLCTVEYLAHLDGIRLV